MRRLFCLTVIVVLVIPVATAAAAATSDVAAVSATGWNPDPITISPGDTVSWTNATGFAHNVCVASDGAAPGANCSEFKAPASPTASWGGAVSHMFTAAGTYHYECQLHTGMQGTVTVLGGPAAISGHVWDDANGDRATSAGEAGVASVTVALTPQGAGAPSATTATGSDGAYSFASEAPGSYSVSVQVPDGWGATATAARSVALNGTDAMADFYIAQRTASVAGTVVDDANGNGARDAAEAGISSVTVFLDTNGNGLLDANELSQVSAADGTYTFTSLLPGSYRMSYVIPSGRQNTGARPRLAHLNEGEAATAADLFTRTTPPGAATTTTTSSPSTTSSGAPAPSGTDTPSSFGATAPPAAPGCRVPRLRGLTLARAKRTLTKAHCRLGRATKRRAHHRRGTVIAQSPRAGLRTTGPVRLTLAR